MPTRLTRRGLLTLAAGAVVAACSRGDDEPTAGTTPGPWDDAVWTFVGTVEDVATAVDQKAPIELPDDRLYLSPWVDADPVAEEALDGLYAVTGDGVRVVAVGVQCPVSGCRVPWCQTAQLFECPCHGGRFTRAGMLVQGSRAALRGLSYRPLRIRDGRLEAAAIGFIDGDPRPVTPEAEGPSCIDGIF